MQKRNLKLSLKQFRNLQCEMAFESAMEKVNQVVEIIDGFLPRETLVSILITQLEGTFDPRCSIVRSSTEQSLDLDTIYVYLDGKVLVRIVIN